jgi:NADH-ubiquinone oxidoreductase chain 6
MYFLYSTIETYTNGYLGEFLDILSLISIIFGIFTIISKNPIVSVLFLIFLFSSVSIYLIMLGINFIGISYLLVYVGAVSILFIFILMLINIRISELLSTTGNSIPLAIMITLSFYYPISQIISYNTAKFKILNLIPTDVFQLVDFISYIFRIYKYDYEISFATSKN